MESNNTFNGMSSDISKLYMSNREYLRAKNFRPTTVLGQSNGALCNIKGNNCEVKFPILRNVFRFVVYKVYDFVSGVFIPQDISVTVNGQTTATIPIRENTTPADVAAYIQRLSNCYAGTYDINKTFSVSYNSDYLFIYQNSEYRGCSITESQTPIITVNDSSGSTLAYYPTNNTATGLNTPYINDAPTDPLVVIGSTFINEAMYLFTCGKINTQGLGQIWELTYSEATKFSTLKLLYNNYIGFSKEHPIPPTAATGRYELPDLQRIYWSDNSNPVRSINVKDINVFAISPEILDMRPRVSMSVPTLYDIIQGGADDNINILSTYQCAYRMVKNNGAITNYSPPSAIVYPIPQATTDFLSNDDKYASIAGGAGTVDKAIKWQVHGVDTNYDTIEFVVIVRNYPSTDGYAVYQFDTQPIAGSTTMYTTFINDSDHDIDISLSEFLIDNSSFSHCKTMDQKDNRLFFGNVRSELGDYLNTYDTRAYRFSTASSNTLYLKNYEADTSLTTYTILSDSDYQLIPENADAICPFNLALVGDFDNDPLWATDSRYQRNSTTIGGTGPNISYKFGSLLLGTDGDPLFPVTSGSTLQGTSRDDGGSTQAYPNGYRRARGTHFSTFDKLLPDQVYQTHPSTDTNTIKATYGLEYINGIFKGYQHNEIYRFGIMFYSKNGTESFVKWIGDIKFPNYSDPVGIAGSTSSGTLSTDFRSMLYDAGDGAYSNVPYIEFLVNIPTELAAIIEGFEIVRVERKLNDRSIAAHGLITQWANNVGSTTYQLPVTNFIEDGVTVALDPGNGTGDHESPDGLLAFHPFNYLADGNTANMAVGDRLLVAEGFGYVQAPQTVWPFVGAVPTTEAVPIVTKYYNLVDNYLDISGSLTLGTLYLSEISYVGIGGSITINSKTLDNIHTDSGSLTRAIGSPAIALNVGSFDFGYFNSGGNFYTSVGADGGNAKLTAIHFKPTVLLSQYGGRTLLARSQNEYISVGSFCRVTTDGGHYAKCFGGDTYHGIVDYHKALRNNNVAEASRHSQTWYLPTHCTYNVDLRRGSHVNADMHTTNTLADITDEYYYDISYSYEDTVRKFLPKPLTFNETSSYYNRIYWSEVKISGEPNDSWSVIPVNNYYDLDGGYGPITSLISIGNNMHAIQERALATLLINPYSVITDSLNQPLKLGSGGTLEKHIYIALDVGTKHQWSVSASNKAITFLDINSRKIYVFDGSKLEPISDTKGNKGFLNRILHDYIVYTDNPILYTGLITTYDFTNNEFLYTFLNKVTDENLPEKYTLAYSDLTNSFTAFYDFTPYIYINNHNKLYSLKDYEETENKLYLHNIGDYCTFYDELFQSNLKVLINPEPLKTKVFDNLSWVSEAAIDEEESITDLMDYTNPGGSSSTNYLTQIMSPIRCYNEYQNTDFVAMDINPGSNRNIRKNEQGFTVQIPRNKVEYSGTLQNQYNIFDPTILTKTEFGERLRDKYMIVDLVYNNVLNARFILHNLKCTYRVSDR